MLLLFNYILRFVFYIYIKICIIKNGYGYCAILLNRCLHHCPSGCLVIILVFILNKMFNNNFYFILIIINIVYIIIDTHTPHQPLNSGVGKCCTTASTEKHKILFYLFLFKLLLQMFCFCVVIKLILFLLYLQIKMFLFFIWCFC